jgi:hypothetical protein
LDFFVRNIFMSAHVIHESRIEIQKQSSFHIYYLRVNDVSSTFITSDLNKNKLYFDICCKDRCRANFSRSPRQINKERSENMKKQENKNRERNKVEEYKKNV